MLRIGNLTIDQSILVDIKKNDFKKMVGGSLKIDFEEAWRLVLAFKNEQRSK
jgi:hypothetical protein